MEFPIDDFLDLFKLLRLHLKLTMNISRSIIDLQLDCLLFSAFPLIFQYFNRLCYLHLLLQTLLSFTKTPINFMSINPQLKKNKINEYVIKETHLFLPTAIDWIRYHVNIGWSGLSRWMDAYPYCQLKRRLDRLSTEATVMFLRAAVCVTVGQFYLFGPKNFMAKIWLFLSDLG
jgi:hypothetical protein